ncbi:taurine dioxygenase [Superficieibacter electus]|uniref:Taurine dioxygenase n=1 Tax=Superficieibacter electus TaxID=2022662 RepID=A0A2P5GVQ7_9ENTR|nr:TauD/TfdA family dioxygenase [Superficieibacter electus]POP47627.1 taurine dioxygenase [Superficieibacter electus]POP50638.1 taurine dioxygenase [Superficieibacter electus]
MTSAITVAHGDFDQLDVHPVAGNIGAEVRNISLSADLSDDVIQQIENALVKYKVLFFRRQHQLTDEAHQAFGARFGKIVAHPTVPSPEGTKLFELDASKGGGRADSWHTDVTFVEAFPKISILRGVTIPEYGGDTVWANTARAYELLPEALKQFVGTLRAVHTNNYDYAAERLETDEKRLHHHKKVFVSSVWEAEHPVVHVHPLSGERVLLLGHFVKNLVGFSSRESAQLFELLQNRIIRLENTVRWQWQQDDVVIWDNRSTQHYAVNDYGTQPRVVRRVTVEGEPAVGIDGSRSRTVARPQDAVNEVPSDNLTADVKYAAS